MARDPLTHCGPGYEDKDMWARKRASDEELGRSEVLVEKPVAPDFVLNSLKKTKPDQFLSLKMGAARVKDLEPTHKLSYIQVTR